MVCTQTVGFQECPSRSPVTVRGSIPPPHPSGKSARAGLLPANGTSLSREGGVRHVAVHSAFLWSFLCLGLVPLPKHFRGSVHNVGFFCIPFVS